MSDDLVGIASHGGEHSHAHWVSLDGTLTTHLDRWGLKAGAILLLPKTIMSHVWFWQRLGRADSPLDMSVHWGEAVMPTSRLKRRE